MRSGVEISEERIRERIHERHDELEIECAVCGFWFIGVVCPNCGTILDEVNDNE